MENNGAILQKDNLACPLIGHQEVTVCLPITVKPYARTGIVKTKCCGAAVIRPGSKNCAGVKDGECSFTVTQKLRVDIPVVFGAKAITGDSYVCCLNPCADFCEDVAAEEEEEEEDDEEYDEEEEEDDEEEDEE